MEEINNHEKWTEVYTKEQLLRLQQIELSELLIVKRICDQLNIRFVLYGGTLLGAVKYKGFIPWDDDIDIAMSREDYEKFLKEASNYLPANMVLQNLQTEPNSPYSYTKLRLKGTKLIEKFNHDLNIEQGIYMDIYPIDDIPDNDILYKKQFKTLQRLFSAIYKRQCLHIEKKQLFTLRGAKSYLLYKLYRLLPISSYIKKQNREMTKFNDQGFQRKTCWHYPNINNYYEQFYPLQEIEFEGHIFYAPFDTYSHLKRRYGNIEELPPLEKRLGHKVYIVDFGKYKNSELYDS